MASPSGTSSGSSQLLSSGSEEDLQAVMDQKKRKRMISNRESARRSRMRKQKQLADLTAEVMRLRRENDQAVVVLNLTTQSYSVVEAENSVLRAQAMELTYRLQSLNDIVGNLNGNSIGPWNFWCMNRPIMASAENMLYY